MSKSSKSVDESKIRTDRCFNPFGLSPHPTIRNIKSLRKVQEHHLLALNNPITEVSLARKICNTCRHKLPKLGNHDEKSSKSETTQEVRITANFTLKS